MARKSPFELGYAPQTKKHMRAIERRHFSLIKKTIEDQLTVVTRNGKPSAVILGITDEDEIERLSLAYSPKFNRILNAARRDIRKGKGIPHDEFWAEMEGAGK